MKFIFDCTDEICLPAAYRLVDDFKPFAEKVRKVDIAEGEKKNRKELLRAVLENIMVKYPKETGELMARLWVLDDGESAPNTFKTLSVFFSNEVAMDFFTSVLPSLVQISKTVSPMLK